MEVDMPRRSISRVLVVLAVCALLTPLAGPAAAASNSRVTNDGTANSYRAYDGSTDAALTACSTGRRAENEPTVAVNPHDPDVIAAGSNEYCLQTVGGDVWAGIYRSTDGGSTWSNSLVPGYPGDTSPAGTSSPTTGVCNAAGDPTQSFDNDGRLFYGFICFNRAKPSNGNIYVATYENDGADYAQTTRVVRGTPSVWGVFNDKVNLVVDQTSGPRSGTIYIGWVRYPGQAANNVLEVVTSTDHGATFSKPVKVSQGHGEEQFADLAVGPDGRWGGDLLGATGDRLVDLRFRWRSVRPGRRMRRRPVRLPERPDLPTLRLHVRGRGGPFRRSRGVERAPAVRPEQGLRAQLRRRVGVADARHPARHRSGASVVPGHRVGGRHHHRDLLRLADGPRVLA
jgi:hypothetical protein